MVQASLFCVLQTHHCHHHRSVVRLSPAPPFAPNSIHPISSMPLWSLSRRTRIIVSVEARRMVQTSLFVFSKPTTDITNAPLSSALHRRPRLDQPVRPPYAAPPFASRSTHPIFSMPSFYMPMPPVHMLYMHMPPARMHMPVSACTHHSSTFVCQNMSHVCISTCRLSTCACPMCPHAYRVPSRPHPYREPSRPQQRMRSCVCMRSRSDLACTGRWA